MTFQVESHNRTITIVGKRTILTIVHTLCLILPSLSLLRISSPLPVLLVNQGHLEADNEGHCRTQQHYYIREEETKHVCHRDPEPTKAKGETDG